MGDHILALEREYCPPIDSALFYALLSDYDLSDQKSLQELRSTLNVLRANADAGDAQTFDPSGSSAQHESSSMESSTKRASSWHGGPITEDTELTGLSHTLESTALDEEVQNAARNLHHDIGMEELSTDAKLQALQEMFPTTKDFDRQYALKQAKGNFGKTIEILLNHIFLEEESASNGTNLVHRGVDGFADPQHHGKARGRKAKGKQRKQTRRTSSTPAVQSDQTETFARSRWDRAKADVDFIAERIYMTPKTISSIYHQAGASLPATITALCTSSDSMASNPFLASASPSILQAHAAELGADFPTIPYTHLESLVRMTHPSEASAHELAKAMLVSTGSSSSDLAIVPQYIPRPASPPSSSQPRAADPQTPLPAATAATLATVRANAMTQAGAAYRKSRSKPLMGGAAAYYSSVGRDAAAALAQHEAATADALVSAQSKSGEIDLHGVNVRDAVRITRTRVQEWWDGGAAEWARRGKVQGDGGFRVVTGVGRHSAGGRSKLGPAVGAMLVGAGWKVEFSDGVVVVRGRARKN